ncbi:16956_t:CDS:2, partial [Entrophospora sp. SA101]
MNAEGTSGSTSKGGSKKGRKLKTLTAIKKKELCGWSQLEEALLIWVNLANEANYTITGAILSQKAVQFAQRLNISDFKSSRGWISNFKKRKNIKEHYKSGEAASAPISELPAFRTELQSIIAQYELEDVY